MSQELVLLMLAGFLAQLVDGALGMAYGTITATLLLSLGIPPVNVSAAVHSAQVFTCAASGLSHLYHRNVVWGVVLRLAVPGVVGAVIGAVVLANVDGAAIRPWVAGYLGCLGVVILLRALRGGRKEAPSAGGDRSTPPLGFAGAFLDTVGGGGWGPIVTTTLIGQGHQPRFVVGSVNLAEFIVKTCASASFLVLIGLTHASIVLALVLGGILAAPFGGYMAKVVPPRPFMALIGLLVLLLTGWQLLKAVGIA